MQRPPVPRILIIEDNASLRSTIARLLESEGHDVAQAKDGKAGIAHALGYPVDLVITDINMPEMDGIEVILQLQERKPDLPVVAMSGGGLLPKEVLLGNAGHLGAVAVIAKPLEADELLGTVQRLLA